MRFEVTDTPCKEDEAFVIAQTRKYNSARAKRSETRARRIHKACEMLAAAKRRVCCVDRSGFYRKNFGAPLPGQSRIRRIGIYNKLSALGRGPQRR
jgi:hypothetical protein